MLVRFVRHGRAAAGWDDDVDPDLDDVGRRQAEDLAVRLGPIGPLEVVTSPLLRCRSTAGPLCRAWGVDAVVEPAVAEIPSPPGVPMGRRVTWLREAMTSTWAGIGGGYPAYRDAVVALTAARTADTVVLSHFVAINAVVGACLGDDRLVIRSLDNCSVTTVEVGPGGLRLVESGHEADTLIR